MGYVVKGFDGVLLTQVLQHEAFLFGVEIAETDLEEEAVELGLR
mgnify:CR=1 FL=1